MPAIGTKQITTALTNDQVGQDVTGLTDKNRLSLIAEFTHGSGGTNASAYIQTSLDAGTTWYDIAAFQFTTASGVKQLTCLAAKEVSSSVTLGTGALAANTAINGLLGDRIRVLVTSTGTYAGNTSLKVSYYATA